MLMSLETPETDAGHPVPDPTCIQNSHGWPQPPSPGMPAEPIDGPGGTRQGDVVEPDVKSTVLSRMKTGEPERSAGPKAPFHSSKSG